MQKTTASANHSLSLLISARREAFALAALTGRDPRGIVQALLYGLDRIKAFETREMLREPVTAWRATHIPASSESEGGK